MERGKKLLFPTLLLTIGLGATACGPAGNNSESPSFKALIENPGGHFTPVRLAHGAQVELVNGTHVTVECNDDHNGYKVGINSGEHRDQTVDNFSRDDLKVLGDPFGYKQAQPGPEDPYGPLDLC